MADFHKSALIGAKTELEGVSWHGAKNTKDIINTTNAALPGKEELRLESELAQDKGILSYLVSLFKPKNIEEGEKITPSLSELSNNIKEVPSIPIDLPAAKEQLEPNSAQQRLREHESSSQIQR